MGQKRYFISLTAVFVLSVSTFSALARGRSFSGPLAPLNHYFAPQDSLDKLKYPIKDREGDFLTNENDNPFLLNDPKAIEKNVEYDPETDRYILTETMDGRNVKPPTYLTFDEYLAYERKQSNNSYWENRAQSLSLVEKKGIVPKLHVGGNIFDRLFGGSTIDIKPSGNIDLTFGGNVQKIDNPTLTERQRKQGGFDFDMNINMNVVGKIGEKVKLNMTYNTQATFDFENQIKINYEGEEDDIIKLIEAGNVNFSLPTSLITGTQSLFGFKTRLQFGRLTLTNVYSQQKSRSETLTIEKGAQISTFEIFADQYDENRHFFLSHYFRDNYNRALSNLPIINSLVNITQVEVWVTNKTGATERTRDIVALMDIGENDPYSRAINPISGRVLPDNNSNDLYQRLQANPNSRSRDRVAGVLTQEIDLINAQDFEEVFARKLSPTEYSFHPQLGYISLNQTLFTDEILGVAYEYTFNGQTYKVGELAMDVPPTFVPGDSSATTNVIFVKLMKGTSARPALPVWDLMMKNIYPLGAFQVNSEDFKLNVVFQDPGGGVKRYIPEGNLAGTPLIRLLELDNLNNQNDPQPDGVFDFVPGITINPNNGRVMFPVLEPFGDDLRVKFEENGEGLLANKYVYDQLYDSTKAIAQQFPQYNRFVLQGSYRSSVSNEISLGAFNVPEGSVIVTAGGQQLIEGQDYTIEYSLGRVTILNEGILNSGVPINVNYENNALFGFQTRTLFGMRADYWISDKFTLGATMMQLRERPFTQKVNIGDDPISNAIYGFDFNYNTESQFLTWLVDKLPLYETKEPSSFSIVGEMARLKPGHQKAIGKEGTVYIDDFEGTRNSYDLKFPAISWHLASTPSGARDRFGNVLFPEADLTDSLSYGFNRAKLAWYNIDPLFLRDNNATPNHIRNDKEQQSNHYVREVQEQEVFPNRTQLTPGLMTNILTFDLAYYPDKKGPYNFDTRPSRFSAGVNADGSLRQPSSRWGGIMRSIDNTDFEAANIEFIEFWVLDPFIYDTFATGGDFYINLGNVSEDINKDSRMFFENGLQGPNSTVRVDTTSWGLMPTTVPIVNAFDNNPAARDYQDVGLDGLNSQQERDFFDWYLDDLANILNPAAFDEAFADPSNDDYHYYQGSDYDANEVTILDRYLRINNPEGNSPVSSPGQIFSEAATNFPNSEDLNRDFTLNRNEEYFQYRIPLSPNMQVGDRFITDKVTARVTTQNGVTSDVTWYQFQIPINEYERRVGNIPDFKSIRFVRMFLSGFEDPIIMRFARLELVRNQWRRYLFDLKDASEYIPGDDLNETFFNVSAVNVEENSSRQPIPYALPPDIQREQNLSSQNITALQNEQSLQVSVCNLRDGDSKAVHKNLNLDLRTYKRLQMFIHGEANPEFPLNDGDLTVFIRLGSDFTNNYYEYALPLTITPPGNYNPDNDADQRAIWPIQNDIDIPLERFYQTKLERNEQNINRTEGYTTPPDAQGRTITVVGNPDLGMIKTAMLGVRNPAAVVGAGDVTDDGLPKCAVVWFNELRVTGLDEEGGWAALARMETQLADLANIVVSTNMHTQGYGQIEQKVEERFRDNFVQYDVAGSIDLGKFIPKKVGFRIPMYASISQSFSTPQFDPYELDVPLNEKLDILGGSEKREYKRQIQDLQTIKSINFTNVRIIPESKDNKPRFYDPANLNFTFAYTATERSDPFIESDLIQKYKAALGYNYSPQAKYLFPFKKLIKSKSKYLGLVSDLNLNFIPSNLSFSTDMNRQFGETRLRTLGDEDFPIEPTYDKYFTWDRNYGLKYNPTRSITVDFTAINNARIDEPAGKLERGSPERDSLWSNILDWGRTTRYQHNFGASYNAPLSKIPILDWTQARASYNANYSWTTGGFTRDADRKIIENPLGNTIGNSQNIRLNGELNFKKLYDKANVLKTYNASRASSQDREQRKKRVQDNQKKKDKLETDIEKLKLEIENIKEDIKAVKVDKEEENKKDKIKRLREQRKAKKQRIKKLRKDKGRIQNPENPFVSPFVRPIISVKRISANYTRNKTTTVPGYMPKTTILGMNHFNQPGWDFIFGYQPDTSWLTDAANQGWMTTDTNLNYQYMQSVSNNMDFKAVVEPFRDLRVDLTLNRTISDNYSEYFKKRTPDSPFEHLNPMTTGSYSISFIAIRTIFNKANERGITQEFKDFENYRTEYSRRLSDQNPNSTGIFLPPDQEADTIPGFRDGYGPYSNDVLIPAFIAAYTGKDLDKVRLNPFKTIPLPNWRITYNGLTKFPFFKKIFSSVTISHAYTSTMSVNSYISNLDFEGNGYLEPSSRDTLTGSFTPLYNIGQIVISEQLSPLIGIDITWANNITTRFDYKKTRNLSMSFIDYQLSESKTTELTFGFGYRLKGLTIPFKIKGRKRKLNNEINFRVDFSYRDNVTINQRLDRDFSEPTRGTKTIRVAPSIDYVINNRLNIRIFFDRNKSIPATSASFPITNTRAGITLRFSLAP